MSDPTPDGPQDRDGIPIVVRRSEMEDLHKCPRKWWFGWVLYCAVTSAPHFGLGTLVHEILESYHRGNWPGEHLADIALTEGEIRGIDVRSVLHALERYPKATRAMYERYVPLLIEHQEYVPIPDTDLMLEVTFDIVAIDARDDRKVIIDHKTTSRFDTRYLRMDDQATAYIWASQAKYMIFSYLRKIIKPKEDTELFQQVMVARTEDQLKRFQRRLASTAEVAYDGRRHAVQTGAVPDITPGWHCRECDYLVACGFMEHGQEDEAEAWMRHNAPPQNPIEWHME